MRQDDPLDTQVPVVDPDVAVTRYCTEGLDTKAARGVHDTSKLPVPTAVTFETTGAPSRT